MRVTARGLNRATLGRQVLLGREALGVVDGVRRVVALQAQQAASPYIALWNRLAGFDPAELDAAFADGTVVKATLMRITLHAVAAGDYPDFHRAMVPSLRGPRLGDKRFTGTGLTAAQADALVPALLEFLAEGRTRVEVEAELRERLGVDEPRMWWALRTFMPLWHVPTGGPWSFGTKATLRAAPRTEDDREAATRQLVRRYLEGFGPASLADVAQFSILGRGVVRQAVEGMGAELVEQEGPDGARLFDVPGGLLPDADTPAPVRLLGMWDSCLLAYCDRARIIPPQYRDMITRRNGDVLPALLVDGYVAGVWRAVGGVVEVTPFHPLGAQVREELAAEAAGLTEFLRGREPGVYSRYHHWWTRLR